MGNVVDQSNLASSATQSNRSLRVPVLKADSMEELRDVVLAVLGHDLRTPLAAIAAGAKILREAPDLAHRSGVALMLERSVARMRELIDTLLVSSRDGLTDRLSITHREGRELELALRSLVEEFRTTWSGRVIVCDFDLQLPLECDMARVIQLAANLLSNALVHSGGGPVHLRAISSADRFELVVNNSGEPLSPDLLERACRPIGRASRKGRHGMGLGLYIASAIARAHGGGINLTCENRQVCFAFRMPVGVGVPASEHDLRVMP
jgi:phosphoserine phosphatase RsbU/P